MSEENNYVFANEREGRFGALEELYDQHTARHIEALRPSAGWTCLEIGAGAGSIARHLSRRIAPGKVVATDLDISRLTQLAPFGIEVWRHDIGRDPLPEHIFDFVHARLVLMHLPDAASALSRVIRSLKPGGWLLVEEFDAGALLDGETGPFGEAASRTSLATRAAMQDGGIDLRYGRRLPALFSTHGLVEIGGEARMSLWRGASPGTRLMRANYAALRSAILSAGAVTSDEFERDVARLDDARFAMWSPTMWSVWGRST